jgi:hypothetical protein
MHGPIPKRESVDMAEFAFLLIHLVQNRHLVLRTLAPRMIPHEHDVQPFPYFILSSVHTS